MWQRAVRGIARAVLSKGTSPEIDTRVIRRLLVVRADDGISAALATTPLLRALREGLPHIRIDFLVSPRGATLVDGLFLADRLVPFDRRRLLRNPIALGGFLRALRAAEYDAVIDASPDRHFHLAAALLTRYSGAPVRIGHDRSDAQHFYTHAVPPANPPVSDLAARSWLLGPLQLTPSGSQFESSAGLLPETASAAESLIAERRLAKQRFFVVQPGTRDPGRRLSTERLASIVRKLHEATRLPALVTWGPGEGRLAEELVAASGSAAVIAPPTDLKLLAAILRRGAFALMPYGGAMSLALGCETRLLALLVDPAAARFVEPSPVVVPIVDAELRTDLEDAAVQGALRLLADRKAEKALAPAQAEGAR